MKQNKVFKKIISFICVIALLVNTLWLQTFADEPSQDSIYRELTFSDFGVADGTTAAGIQTWGAMDGLTSMDAVAFEGNVILQDSTGAFWWNAVRLGFGSGANQGGVGVSRTGDRIILYNYCVAGAPEYLGEVGASQHGVSNLDTTAIRVKMTFDYVENNTDVLLTISINGTEYYRGILTDGQNLLGTQMLVWGYDAAIMVESIKKEIVQEPEQPEQPEQPEVTYNELTFYNYGISNGTIDVGNQTYGTAEELTNLAGYAFTGNVTLQDSTDLPHWNAVYIGFGGNAGLGIGVFRSGTSLFLYDYTTGGPVYLADVNQAAHGVADLDTTAVKIRFTFDSVEDSTDMKIGFSVNDKKCYEGVITDGQNLLGNQVLVWGRTAAITVESIGDNVPEEPEQPEETYREVTFYDYGVFDGTTEVGDQTYGTAEELTTMDGVAFEGNVILQDSAGAFWWNAVRVGCGTGANPGGFGISRTGDRIILYNYYVDGAPEYLGEVGAAEHGVSDLDTTALNVRFTFKYIEDSSDVAITISINGKEYYNNTLTNGQNMVSNQLLIFAYDAPITVGSVGDHVPEEPDDAGEIPVLNENFTKLTFASYGLESGTYSASNPANGHCKLFSMDKVVFSDTVNFSEVPYAQLRIGGKDSPWEGIMLSSAGNGRLKLSDTFSGFQTITFNPTVAGTDLVGQDVKMTMSFEYVDYEGDGEKDDVKLGVWFNGKPYNDRWIYLRNKAPELGGFLMIHCPNEDTTLSITTYIPSVDFREYGFSEAWYDELGLSKEEWWRDL